MITFIHETNTEIIVKLVVCFSIKHSDWYDSTWLYIFGAIVLS